MYREVNKIKIKGEIAMRPHKVFLYDEEESRILQESTGLIDLLIQKGLLEDHEISDEKLRKVKKEVARKKYHHTQALLEQYRTIIWVLESAPDEIAMELKVQTKTIDALIEKIEYELGTDNKKLEGKLRTVLKTRKLIDRVNDALSVLKMKPDNGELLYKLVYEAYIDPERRPRCELIERMHVSSRTYYRMREIAVDTISKRLWGSSDAMIDDWLEILILIEGY